MDLPKTIMFYDGGCPLCSREVSHYRRQDAAGRIDWIDISSDPSLLHALGVAPTTAMERLHVLHRDGWLATGAYAFAVIWSELPYYRRLAGILYKLRLLPWLDKAYAKFARWRYRRRCRDGVCALPMPPAAQRRQSLDNSTSV